jgi:hypothetical protein
MDKIFRIMVTIALCFLYCIPVASALEKESEIANYMHIYGYDVPQSIQSEVREAFSPVMIELEDVQITLRELLYDGCWIFTSADVVPTDPSKVLIYPGSAWLEDRVSGNYGENERDDHRPIIEAAKVDGKRAVCVYVYLKEYDTIPVYFLDHLQRANDRSVLLSGAEIEKEEELLPVTWLIKVYEVDTTTGELDLESLVEKTYQATVPLLAPVEKKEYIAQNAQELPFYSMTLIKTGLTVYTSFQWKNEEDQPLPGFILLDADRNQYPGGAPPAGSTYTMESLPQVLYIQMNNRSLDGNEDPVRLVVHK